MPQFFRGSVVVALLALIVAVPNASAHGGGSPNYISKVLSAPRAPGVSVSVLDRDDRLLVRNHGNDTVTIFGYNDEPYARIKPSGQVQVNELSPALYLNEDRFGQVNVPAKADPKATPEWKTLDGSGNFDWHDHRIHWMSKTPPSQVKDKNKRTKIFNWKVPVRVNSQPAAISGNLYWVKKPGGGFPLGAGIAFLVIVLLSGALIVVVRRRRDDGEGEVAEAW